MDLSCINNSSKQLKGRKDMSAEVSAKIQIAIWWITSIAVSVLCCSVLFVLFAGYLVSVKQSIELTQSRIDTIEKRETTILSEIELLRKHVTIQPPVTVAAPATAPASTVEAPVASPAPIAVPAAPTPVEVPAPAPAK